MSNQLRLIDTASVRRLDAETVQIGRKGLAEARQALRQSRDRYDIPESKAA
jgi:hypothetical protein